MSSRSRFSWSSVIPHPKDEIFAWHTRSGAFVRLNDPWRPVEVTRASNSISQGAEVSISLPVFGPVKIPWHLQHTRYIHGEEFVDEQTSGPFTSWKHTHRFIAQDDSSTTMLDEIEYSLPFGCGLAKPLLERELRRLFSFRHALLESDLDLHARWSDKPRKTIVMAGASGFVGRALEAFLTTAGHTVRRLVRRAPQAPSEYMWDPERGILDPHVFSGADVLISLSGENIAAGRWTAKQKERIARSRVETTKLLAKVVSALPKPLEVAVFASGAGFYGNTGEHEADESSPRGAGFLADLSEVWEDSAKPIELSGCRLVTMRLGMVLNATGGALQKMLLPFLCGVGGPLGNGKQWMSWIAMQDLLGIVEHAIYSNNVSGPVNVVSPSPSRNREFAKALGRVLKRPVIISTPATALKAIFGEMAQELLLNSLRVVPAALIASGYRFVFDDLERALSFECGRMEL